MALPPGNLVLGPFARHPAGEVLAGLHGALQAGNIPGVAASFADNARLDSISGRGAIAGHFRAMLARAESRQVDLKVMRLARDGERWRVEAEVAVRVQRDGTEQLVLQGRSNLWLGERDDELTITRMERE